MKLTKAFRGVPNGEIYPVDYAAGDECPGELETAAQAQGCLDGESDSDREAREAAEREAAEREAAEKAAAEASEREAAEEAAAEAAEREAAEKAAAEVAAAKAKPAKGK